MCLHNLEQELFFNLIKLKSFVFLQKNQNITKSGYCMGGF
jgi:hypothetical protein